MDQEEPEQNHCAQGSVPGEQTLESSGVWGGNDLGLGPVGSTSQSRKKVDRSVPTPLSPGSHSGARSLAFPLFPWCQK